MIRILAMFVEKVVNTYEDDYKEEYMNDIKYHLLVSSKKEENGYEEKYTIILSEYNTMCPSGWTTASYGEMRISSNDKITVTHLPKKPIIIKDKYIGWSDDGHLTIFKENKDLLEEDCSFLCDAFSCDYDGGDEWYPSGYVHVNMDLFKETKRGQAMIGRPVYLAYGPSGLGKTTLFSYLDDNKKVYETDSSKTLPEEIWADVIIIGNKYNYSIKDVVKHLPKDTQPIKIGFEKIEEVSKC